MKHTHTDLAEIMDALINGNGLLAVVQAVTESTLNSRDYHEAEYQRTCEKYHLIMSDQLQLDSEQLTECWKAIKGGTQV